MVQVYGNGSIILPKNSPNCTILDSSAFDNVAIADELFAKALGSLEACLSVNNILCRKQVSSLG